MVSSANQRRVAIRLTAPTIGSIAYNPAGQIVSQVRSNDSYAWTGHYNVNRNYTVNGLNQQTAAGATALGYDGRGNLTSSGSNTYSYNRLNQLTAGPGGVTLTYDPTGRLNQVAAPGGTARFVYAGTMPIEERNASGVLLRRYVPGPGVDEPVVWYEGSATTDRRWLHADERGSVIAVSNGSGAMLAINRYDEFGIPQSTNAGRFQYTGQMWLPELGIYSFKARMYSPTLGRFLQTDPIGYGDGMNWYNYVGGDPVNFADPSGLGRQVWSDRNAYCAAHPPGTPYIFVRATGRAFDGTYEEVTPTGGGGECPGIDFNEFIAEGVRLSGGGTSPSNEIPRTMGLPRPDYCNSALWKFGNTTDETGQILGDVGTFFAPFTEGGTVFIAQYGTALTVVGAASKSYAGDPHAFLDLMPAAIPFAGKGVVPAHLRSELKDAIADLAGSKAAEFLFPKDRCK